MTKASGVLLIFAGLGVAAYAMPSEVGEPVEMALAEEVVVVKAATPVTPATVSEVTPARFSAPVIAPVPQPAVRPASAPLKTTAPAAVRPTVVTARVTEAVRTPMHVTQPGNAAALPGDRAGLTRELQRELKRVGCYEGEISGVWAPSSRRAMKAFTDRVNATLPTDQPDFILLALVRSHSEQACGAACPAGQAASDNGRCLPIAVMAQAAKKQHATEDKQTSGGSWSTTTVAVAPSQAPNLPDLSTEGRMSLSGPRNESGQGRDQARLAIQDPNLASGMQERKVRQNVASSNKAKVATKHRKQKYAFRPLGRAEFWNRF